MKSNKKNLKGYDIFDFDGTGMLEIQKVDDEGVFPDDESAVEQAVKDGIAIIPVDELPENFTRRYFGWIDTPENRERIAAFCKEYCPAPTDKVAD